MIRAIDIWIDVNQELPENKEENKNKKRIKCFVLLRSVYPNGKPIAQVSERYWNGTQWQWSKNMNDRVIYWMSVPEL